MAIAAILFHVTGTIRLTFVSLRTKGELWPLGLIYCNCSIKYGFGFNSYQKKINFILNALGSKFDLDVEVLKVNLRW